MLVSRSFYSYNLRILWITTSHFTFSIFAKNVCNNSKFLFFWGDMVCLSLFFIYITVFCILSSWAFMINTHVDGKPSLEEGKKVRPHFFFNDAIHLLCAVNKNDLYWSLKRKLKHKCLLIWIFFSSISD